MADDKAKIQALENKAKELRKDILRMLEKAGSGHPGGSLSAIDMMTALYFYKLNIKPEKPDWPDRDRFVLSKGHAAPALYACLAEKGFFPKKELDCLRKINCMLQGHPSKKLIPGVEASTGSLGQGLSMAVGMAIAGKLDKKAYGVYVVVGDGEMQEGQIWEAAMAAAHYKLDNITVFIDNNNLQIDGNVDEVMSVYPIKEKWQAFGWKVIEIDGHDIKQIIDALDVPHEKGKPKAILANTTKGKGVSFMENKAEWHGVAPKKEELDNALGELE
ncbi:transketolase [Nanoarchaeota archaeon]